VVVAKHPNYPHVPGAYRWLIAVSIHLSMKIIMIKVIKYDDDDDDGGVLLVVMAIVVIP